MRGELSDVALKYFDPKPPVARFTCARVFLPRDALYRNELNNKVTTCKVTRDC